MKLPKTIATNTIKIGPMEMVVHILDNGVRVIEEQSIVDFFDFLSGGGRLTDAENLQLTKLAIRARKEGGDD